LVLAMFVLIVIGALVGGSYVAGWLEQRGAEQLLFSAQAAEGAEAGIADALATVTPASLNGLLTEGAPISLPPMSLAGGIAVDRQVSRLTGNLFFLVARTTRLDAGGGALAVCSIGVLVQLVADSGSGLQTVTVLRRRAWVQLY
jgi:hypothetical protein